MAKSKKVPKKCLNENSQLFVVSKNEVKEIQRLAVSSIDSVLLLPASFAAASATIAITRLCIDSYRFFMFFNLHISIRKEKKKTHGSASPNHQMAAAQDDVAFFYFKLGMQPRLIVIISLFFKLHMATASDEFLTLSWARSPG